MNSKVFTHCNQPHELEIEFEEIAKNERRTLLVVLLTTLMMVVEIIAGYLTGSMALLADGYHMASHAGALGISFLVYRLTKSQKLKQKLTFGTGKLLPLGGYTSSIALAMIALWMAGESFLRFLNPIPIEFNEAILVAILGLLVNVASVFILGFHDHHEHKEHAHDEDDHSHHHVHDHNHSSAVLHVLADALTSVTAIVALLAGKYYGANWLDPIIGIVGAIVILRWAYGLCRSTAKDLLDYHSGDIDINDLRQKLAQDNIELLDLHAWRTGPSNIACQLIVKSSREDESSYYRKYLKDCAKNIHLVVERRT